MRQSLLAAIHQTGDIGGNLGFTEGMDFAFPADQFVFQNGRTSVSTRN